MDRIQLRRDSSARWAEVNPVLLEGEVGFETDTKLRKIGDGVHRWNELDYLRAEGIVQESGDSENVVMSQKAVTEKIEEVENSVESIKTSYGGSINNVIEAKVGELYENRISIKANKGQSVIVNIIGDVSVFSSSAFNLIANYEGSGAEVLTQNTTKIEFVAKDFLKSIVLRRDGSGVVKNGSITLDVKVMPLFMTNEEIQATLNERISFSNYAKEHKDFTIKTNVDVDVSDKNTNVLFLSASSVWGFRINMEQSPFQQGDVLYYGIKNISKSGSNTLRLICIFNNSIGNEISRDYITVTTANSESFKNSVVIPQGTDYIIIRYQSLSANISVSVEDTIVTNVDYKINQKYDRGKIYDNLSIAKKTMVYVNAKNGNDANDGNTQSTALATIRKALSITDAVCTINIVGDVYEAINLKKYVKQHITIAGQKGIKSRIIMGEFINSATMISDNVYKIQLNVAPPAYIFQHGIDDELTLINDSERHPLQRGKAYRCDCTMLSAVSSLSDVTNEVNPSYYYDSATQILYFRIVEGTSLQSNPLVIPRGEKGILGNDGNTTIEICNIEVLYGSMDLSNCNMGKVSDCAVKYANDKGGFIWDGTVGLSLIRCEATRIFEAATTGDGFNAHGDNSTDAAAKYSTCTMIDCWSHDNNDDGYSDHERCETTIIGGLFEYNGKGGLTPSYGAHDTIMGAFCRYNKIGILYTGKAAVAEGGKGGQVLAENCICSENNDANYQTDGNGNLMILSGCKSYKSARVGYITGTGALMQLYDCTENGSPTKKYGDNITIINGSIVG